MTLELRSEAEEEFYDIVGFYNEIDSQLATDFIDEVDQTVVEIIKFPEAGHPYLHNTKTDFTEPLSLRCNSQNI